MYDEIDDDEGENVGLAFASGFYARTEEAATEGTTEIMSFFMPHQGVVVSAFLVDDFDVDDEVGFEVIPHVSKGVSYIRLARNLWEFIEDVAGCEHEAAFFQGLVLGQLLAGTAHRMIFDATGQMPGF